jgi:hypothetical protein
MPVGHPQRNIAWLEHGTHPGLTYYDALQEPLRRLGNNVTEVRARSSRGFAAGTLGPMLDPHDVVLVGFGWFKDERGSAGPSLPEFDWRNCVSAAESWNCLCKRMPLIVLLNKEYALLKQKLAWIKQHCVSAALSVHHDVAAYQELTGVPFHRIWFGRHMHYSH